MRRILLTFVFAALVTPLLWASPATADVWGDRATRVAKEVVGGPLYGKYKKKFPRSFNWENDGCSIPAGYLDPPMRPYVKFFEASCNRHDFAYRNHDKSGFGMSRSQVDRRFYNNMRHECRDRDTSNACYTTAKVFYHAVRDFGDRYW